MTFQGWWPRINPAGTRVTFQRLVSGVPHAFVKSLDTGAETDLGIGRSPAWIEPEVICFWDNLGPARWVRYESRFSGAGWITTPTLTPPDLAGGNSIYASGGHWSACIHGQRAVFDGQVLPLQAPYGSYLQQNGPHLWLSTQASGLPILHHFASGAEVGHFPAKGTASQWIVGAAGEVGYGYFGTARLLFPDGRDQDVTVTPWKKEGPPFPVMAEGALWLWSGTEHPISGESFMVGRPLGDSKVLRVAVPGAQTHVVYLPGTREFVLAGNDPHGHAASTRISLDAPRAVLPNIQPPILMPVLRGYGWYGWIFPWTRVSTDTGEIIYPPYPGLTQNCGVVLTPADVEEAMKTDVGLVVNLDNPGMEKATRPFRIQRRTVATYCSGGNVAALIAACAHAYQKRPRIPRLALCDFTVTGTLPHIPHASILGLEVYANAGESPEACEARLKATIQANPTFKSIWLIGQSYDRGGITPASDLPALQATWARIADRESRVDGILLFAANRANGLRGYPDLLPLQQKALGKLKTPPIVRI